MADKLTRNDKSNINMKYENRYVLFLDILGFKKLVQETEIDDTKVKALHTALSIIRGFATSGAKLPRNATQFSDSIVISFTDENNSELILLLDEIIDLLMAMIRKGIICRGAISYGKFYHDDKILFGPALVDAYETETKAAMYPRIILDKSVLKVFKEGKILNSRNKLSKDYINQFLKEDLDDRLYIDYFEYPISKTLNLTDYNSYMSKLREIIQTESAKAKSADIKVKYGWMKHKFNAAIKNVAKNKFVESFNNPNTKLVEEFYKIKPL